ncbi:MAG: Asp-tRNA(Asn)/Glu-tRNA(Gln) amidotransferase subunit GatC [Patescibacteria group bacterium]
MKQIINKKTLEHLAILSRIDIEEQLEEKILADLEKILEYFTELKNLDALNIKPMAGGTILTDVFRQDQGQDKDKENEKPKCAMPSDNLTEAFPKKENGFLKVPGVFE